MGDSAVLRLFEPKMTESLNAFKKTLIGRISAFGAHPWRHISDRPRMLIFSVFYRLPARV
jgi:hypothetical protein